MSNRNVEFYMGQPYPVVLEPLSDEQGGGWLAEIKELPGCMADGETPQEAIDSIKEAMQLWLTIALREGRSVALPDAHAEGEYSGRVTLRMPKSLHRKLVEVARKEGMSLNQLLLSQISYKTALFEAASTRRRSNDGTTQGGHGKQARKSST